MHTYLLTITDNSLALIEAYNQFRIYPQCQEFKTAIAFLLNRKSRVYIYIYYYIYNLFKQYLYNLYVQILLTPLLKVDEKSSLTLHHLFFDFLKVFV